MAFQCVIVTPEQQLLDESVEQVILPAHDGLMGILTDRAPLLVKLGLGQLKVDQAGGKHRSFLIDGGVAQMKDNHLTILTSAAWAPESIDLESARAEFAEAQARNPRDEKTASDRQHQMQRAKLKEAMAVAR